MKNLNIYISILLFTAFLPQLNFGQASAPNLVYNNGGQVYLQSGAVLHVQGDLVNKGSGSFINNGLLSVEGDISNSATFAPDSGVGEGTVRLIGSPAMAGSAAAGAQTLSGALSSSGASYFYNLVIDGTASGQVIALGGNVTVTGSLVWNGSATSAATYNPSNYPSTLGNSAIMQVRGSMPSGSGVLQTSGYQVYIPSVAPTAMAGYDSVAYINGYLKRAVSASGSYDLPVGSASHYELANITFSPDMSGVNTLTANFNTTTTTQPQPDTCIINGSPISSLLNGGYWTIHPDNQPTAGTYTATLSMRGFANAPGPGAGLNGAVSPGEQIGIVKRSSASAPWLGCGVKIFGKASTDQGYGSCSPNGTIAGGVATVSRSLVPSFSDFGIGIEAEGTYALPIDLISLSAMPVGDSYIHLDWATASEQDDKGFEVMRSTDGTTYTGIGWVDGSGTTTNERRYGYDDHTALPGVIYYYRLDQVDADGQSKETYIVSASISAAGGGVSLSELIPNPTCGNARITISSATAQQVEVNLYDVTGRLVMAGENNQVSAGQNTINLDLRANAPGTYTAAIRVGDNMYSRKVVLVR